VAEARTRAAARLLELAPASGHTAAEPDRAHEIPPLLRRRVLDSIYGAGERLPSLYSTPRVAERIFGWLRRRSPIR
jgi:hypothetical protein